MTGSFTAWPVAALLGLLLQQGGQQGAQLGPLEAFGELAPRWPNVLLVVSDDLGVDHLAWHPVGVLAGNPAPTPVMASLAAQGVVFTEAYAAPICGPSRACLLTGRLPFRHGLGDNPIEGEAELPYSEWTLAEALRAEGYATGGFGKWHVSLERDDPNLQGFDHFDGTIAGLKNASYYLWPRVVDGVGFNESGYNTSVVTDSAIDWIRAQGAGPWFAYVAYSAPHKPMERPPLALNPITQAKATSTELELYHGTIEALDTELGRLIATVDLRTTLVLFLGDNGTPKSVVQSPVVAAKAKQTAYQGGVLVPAIVLGATVNGAGEERAGPIHLVDVYRTVLDAAGAPKTPAPIDSVSLLAPGLSSSARWQPRRMRLFTERFEPAFAGPDGPFTSLRRTIRDQRYKLLRTELADELYDLSLDPWEDEDLLQGPLTPAQQAAYDALVAALDATIHG